MRKKRDEEKSEEWFKNLPNEPSVESYKAEEMIACTKCQRANPPNRLDCMYCGVDLEISEKQSKLVKPILRKTESYKNGFNLIYLPNLANWDEPYLKEVAKMTQLSQEELREFVNLSVSLPLARTELKKEVGIVAERMAEMGFETLILEDEKFVLEKSARRLRRIEFQDDKIILILFNNDEVFEIKREDLNLIVVGALFEKKVELMEKLKKKGDDKILDMMETSVDEMLLDIYTKDDVIGYRISEKGFDFSCLGDEKKLLANENMKTLIKKFQKFSPNAKFDDNYLRVRGILSNVWEIEERTDSKGLKRHSFKGYNKEVVETTSNLSQFTKYSRLQRVINQKL